jgi:hypothetical protein
MLEFGRCVRRSVTIGRPNGGNVRGSVQVLTHTRFVMVSSPRITVVRLAGTIGRALPLLRRGVMRNCMKATVELLYAHTVN